MFRDLAPETDGLFNIDLSSPHPLDEGVDRLFPTRRANKRPFLPISFDNEEEQESVDATSGFNYKLSM